MIEILNHQLYSIGGPVLVTLIVVSVVATATAVFKLLSLWRLGVGRHRVARDAIQRWTAGDASGAYQLAAADRAALSQVAGEAINGVWRWPDDKDRAREMATGTALSLLDVMSSHVRVLETSVQAAPMLGLLGTVLGMIAAFNEMSVERRRRRSDRAGRRHLGGAVDDRARADDRHPVLLLHQLDRGPHRARARRDGHGDPDDRLRPGSRPGQPGTDRSDCSATRRAANRSVAALSRRMRGIQLRRGSKKGMKFMLMPLVDVIFLLLTFFMLSSKLAPYSALTLGDYHREGAVSTATDAPAQAQPDVILTLSAGEVRANGTALPLAEFPAEAERLKQGGAESVVVFLRPSATAQDIVSVLEALKRTAFASVSVRTRQGAG